MEILNLATKEKQDEILSNFPISGGTDFLQGEFMTYKHQENSRTEFNFNIDGSGIVLGLRVNSPLLSNVKVDSNIIFENNVDKEIIFIPFKQSLEVYIQDSTSDQLKSIEINYLLL